MQQRGDTLEKDRKPKEIVKEKYSMQNKCVFLLLFSVLWTANYQTQKTDEKLGMIWKE